MRVKMKAVLSGTRNGADWPPIGGTIDLPQAEAEHLVAAGLAEKAEAASSKAETVEETATPKAEAETATPKRRPRSGK